MRIPGIALGVCALLGAGAGGAVWLAQQNAVARSARREARLQGPEIGECRQRLGELFDGWQRYRSDHAGAAPPTIRAMLPRHLSSAKQLQCPTAERWRQRGIIVEQGSLRIGRREYPVTYGLHWLAAGYPRLVKKQGDRTPLVTCGVHREGMYRAVYRKAPPLGAFDPDQRNRLHRLVANQAVLAVFRDGRLGVLAPDAE